MNSSSDIWLAFGRTFAMLFFVLAILILAFYLIKKFSEARGIKGKQTLINVLSVHHLSPKEKLVLLNVPGQTLLIGVTPSQISKITKLDQKIDMAEEPDGSAFQFSNLLAKKLGQPSGDKFESEDK